MRFAAAFLLAGLVATSAAPGFAATTPLPGRTDPRIRTVHYDPNQVIELRGVLGYAISVEFSEEEHIENISIGDSLAWQVTPNRRANLMFLKPLRRDATTNLAVFTNLRRYTFDLGVRPAEPHDRNIVFGLRFDYPEPAPAIVVPDKAQPAAPQMPQVANEAYTYQGSPRNLPERVFDDGHATYFLFSAATDYPAIFALDANDQEAVVNVAQKDGYVIVDQLAPAFMLRRGSEITRIFNDGYKQPAPGTHSPKPRQETGTVFDRLFHWR